MERYVIVAREDEQSNNLRKKLCEALDEFMIYDEEHPDLVISVGGDGTMLYSVHRYMNDLEKVYFVGIHTGTLGFFTDYLSNEYLELVHDIRTKSLRSVDRHMLEIHYHSRIFYALNEMRLENNRRSQVIDVYINDEHLERFRGNGLCVCTPSGSTAYNKSINGAVIANELNVMELSEIAGINHNAYRSLGSSMILDASNYILFHTINYQDSVLCVDHDSFYLSDNEVIEINLSKRVARFLNYRRVTFVDRLKKAFL